MVHKQKKKRNKAYHGADAALNRPVVTKISAVNRNPVSQWWFEHKRLAKPIAITAGVAGGAIIVISEIIRLASGG